MPNKATSANNATNPSPPPPDYDVYLVLELLEFPELIEAPFYSYANDLICYVLTYPLMLLY